MPPIIDDELMTVRDAAKRLKCNLATLYRWNTRGVRGGQKLRFTRIGGKSYVAIAELERFIAACSDPPAPEVREQAYAARVDSAESKAAALGL